MDAAGAQVEVIEGSVARAEAEVAGGGEVRAAEVRMEAMLADVAAGRVDVVVVGAVAVMEMQAVERKAVAATVALMVRVGSGEDVEIVERARVEKEVEAMGQAERAVVGGTAEKAMEVGVAEARTAAARTARVARAAKVVMAVAVVIEGTQQVAGRRPTAATICQGCRCRATGTRSQRCQRRS